MDADVLYLSWGAVELLQAVLQPLHVVAEEFTLRTQQAAVKIDLLQERLGRGVVVGVLHFRLWEL